MGEVHVNGRPLTTPQGIPFQTPTLALAIAIEAEWLKDPSPTFRLKPLTSLAATAIDKVCPSPDLFIQSVIQSLSQDTILFWAPTPPALVQQQQKKWGPLIDQVNVLLSLRLAPTYSFSFLPLDLKEEHKLTEEVASWSCFKLAGFCHLLTLTSSFCLSYLITENQLSPEDGWQLARLHEQAQQNLWGKDQESTMQENTLYQEFLETLHFLKLLERD